MQGIKLVKEKGISRKFMREKAVRKKQEQEEAKKL